MPPRRTLAFAVWSDVELRFVFADGREGSAPLEWFPRLRDAAPVAQRSYRLIGGGIGVHRPELDEDISVAGLLAIH
ncbi:MAG: DUF2442 domain-containing protein [Gemmatimonadaceae bacterium]|nr:DUF2442 domain-containing protein [Gemmatimonadaceae bacterium]